MNSAQQVALTELKERIVQSRLNESDTSWIETEEELNSQKAAIIRELHIEEQNLYNGETRIRIHYYYTMTMYIIMGDGKILEYPIKTEKGLGGFRLFLLIMIFVYFLVFFLNVTILGSGIAMLVIIVLGIVNVFLFFNWE